jgi:hypothetical protein
MRPTVYLALFTLALLSGVGIAEDFPFSGIWTIDLRSVEERKLNIECGVATFELVQSGTKITGNHSMATSRCGRINEGGQGTVKGVVVGSTAVLVVISGRNGAIVLGSAKLSRGALQWQITEEVKPGEPEGEPPLILAKGTLLRLKKNERFD